MVQAAKSIMYQQRQYTLTLFVAPVLTDVNGKINMDWIYTTDRNVMRKLRTQIH